MNANEILKAIMAVNLQDENGKAISAVGKAKNTMHHAGKLAAIYKLLTDEQKNIVSVDMVPCTVNFGRTGESEWDKQDKKWIKKVTDKGTPMPGQRFTFTTSRGTYKVDVPENNAFFKQFCERFHVTHTMVAETAKVLITYKLPAAVADSIKKACRFVSKDNLRPVLQCVSLQFSDGKLEIFATDAHTLYISPVYKVPGFPVFGTYNIPASYFKKSLKCNEDHFNFVVLDGDKVSLLGITAEINTTKFPDVRVVTPKYENKIVFSRETFCKNVTQLLPYANKTTSQVSCYFNGAIEMHAQDVDFSTESKGRMAYKEKDTIDFLTSFNGKMIIRAMEIFKSEDITMLHGGHGGRCAIFTDGVDSVLQMPLVTAGHNYDEVYKVDIKKQPVKVVVAAPKVAAVAPTPAPVPVRKKPATNFKPGTSLAEVEEICRTYKDVFIHQYTDCIKIRFMQLTSDGLQNGQKVIPNVEITAADLQELAEQYGKTVIQKNMAALA